jgi:hypothetical protein
VARVGERRYVWRRLVGTAEEKRSLGRHWYRWERRLKKYKTELSGFTWLRTEASDRCHKDK